MTIALVGGAAAVARVAEVGRIVFTLGVLAAALLMLCRWRFRDEAAAGWAATFLLAAGGYLRTEAMNDSLFMTAAGQRSADLVLPTDVLFLLFLMWVCLCAARRVPPVGWRHPLVLGISAGAFLSLARALWYQFAPELPVSAVVLAVLVVYVSTAWIGSHAFMRIEEFPLEARLAMVFCVAIGMAVHHFSPQDLTTDRLWAVSVVALCTSAGVTLVATTFQLVWTAWSELNQRLARLDERARMAEERLHEDEELRHEARATVAGINNASRLLITSNERIPADRRHTLEEMLETEMTRLEALLQMPTCERTTAVELDLDQLLRPLVLVHATQGTDIRYEPVATTVQAPPTHVSRAINTVLSNVRRHAPGATVTISSEMRGNHVALMVRDNGPGVPLHIRDQVFARCSKGSDSVGEGIGLYSARHALRDSGGDLVLEPTDRGATFILLLPR